MQYSVFEFRLDKSTWLKMIQKLHEKKFLTGNHNIIIIPLTDSVYEKTIYLGNMFLAFDYDVLICGSDGVTGIGEKKEGFKTPKSRTVSQFTNIDDPEIIKSDPNDPVVLQILDQIFGNETERSNL